MGAAEVNILAAANGREVTEPGSRPVPLNVYRQHILVHGHGGKHSSLFHSPMTVFFWQCGVGLVYLRLTIETAYLLIDNALSSALSLKLQRYRLTRWFDM